MMIERTIFLTAVEIDDPTERLAYLDRACAGNATMRSLVEELLYRRADGGPISGASPDSVADSATTLLQPILGPDDESTDDGLSANEDFLRYLQPTKRPGWLGRLSHYEIEAILGRGAFGVVAKAFDEKLQRVVAIKMLSPELADSSPSRKRFLREARSAAATRHENIVGIYAVEEQPIPYLVMEYIPGPTLKQWLDENGPLDLRDIVSLGRQIAAGLAAAHAVKLIHRDIKPSNILLEERPGGQLKISDFGLARAVDDASLTTSGLIAGTPMYMSPEQATGETLDHRSDLFSLGSVLYQMTSGRPPFRASSTVSVLRRICDETPPPLQDVIATTPGWLCTIINRLMEKRPENRYQSAQKVADLLALCLRELDQQGVVTCVSSEGEHRKSSTDATGSPKPAGATSGPRKWSSGIAMAGLVALTAVVAGTVFSPARRSNPEKNVVQQDAVLGTSGSSRPATVTAPPQTGWYSWPADAPKPAIAPFDTAQARKHQEEWAAYLKVPVEHASTIGITLRLIPPGEFLMGGTPSEIEEALKYIDPNDAHWQSCVRSEGPQHKVVVTQPAYVATREVTQSEFALVMGRNPAFFSDKGEGRESIAGRETGDFPVEMVTWNDAALFCSKLSEREKLSPVYVLAGDVVTPLKGNGYRLPTEAEWEHACRAGTTTKYWIGNENESLVQAGWYGQNSGGHPHPRSELQSHPFGLYDVHGNVAEWVEDVWQPTLYQQLEATIAVDPRFRDFVIPMRVARGGSWADSAPRCRSSYRLAYGRGEYGQYVGFRVALPVDAVRKISTVLEPAAPSTTSPGGEARP